MKLLFTVVFIQFVDFVHCQSQFSFQLDGGSKDKVHQVISLRDGNFLMLSTTTKNTLGKTDFLLFKFDSLGNTVWSKQIGSEYAEDGISAVIAEDLHDDIWLAGAVVSDKYYGLLCKLNSLGTVLWAKKQYSTYASDLWRCFSLQPNGDLVLGGTSGVNNVQAAEIMRINSSGKIIWSKSHDSPLDPEHYVDALTISGNSYFFGSTPRANGEYGSFMTKVNAIGNTVFSKFYDFSYYDRSSSFIESSNQNSLICVSSVSNFGGSKFGNTDIAVFKVDTIGNLIWSKIIGTSGNDLVSEIVRVDKKYYIAGSTNNFDNGCFKIFIHCIDEDGNKVWTKYYGESGSQISNSNIYKTLTSIANSGLVLVAQKSYSSKEDDIQIFGLSLEGKMGCPDIDFDFSEFVLAPSIYSTNFTDQSICPFENILVTSKDVASLSITNVCNCKFKASFTKDKFSLCQNNEINFTNTSPNSNAKLKWILIKPNREIENYTSKHFKYFPDLTGRYIVKLYLHGNCNADSMVDSFDVFRKFEMPYLSDSFYCTNTFRIGYPFMPKVQFNWQPASFFDDNRKSQPYVTLVENKYLFLQAIDSVTGCVYRDTIKAKVPMANFLGKDSTFCEFNPVKLVNPYYPLGLWNNLSSSPTFIQNKPGLIVLVVKNSSCQIVDSIWLSSVKVPKKIEPQKLITCHQTPTLFYFNDDSTNLNIFWDDGSRNFNRQFIYPKMYRCSIINKHCSYQDSLQVIHIPNTILRIPADTIVCEGERVRIDATTPYSTYRWSNGSQEPIQELFEGKYNLTISNPCGNFNFQTTILNKPCNCDFYIPNAFTPDGSTVNDSFALKTECKLKEFELSIYNRWGHRVFYSQNQLEKWDGKFQNKEAIQEVYVYSIKGIYRHKGLDKRFKKYGHLHLIR